MKFGYKGHFIDSVIYNTESYYENNRIIKSLFSHTQIYLFFANNKIKSFTVKIHFFSETDISF